MSFLVLLLVLWVEKFSAWRAVIQQDGPWLRLLARAEARIQGEGQPWLALLTVVAAPLLVLALLLVVLSPLAYGWLALPVHLLVVIYSLGRGDLLGKPARMSSLREVLTSCVAGGLQEGMG